MHYNFTKIIERDICSNIHRLTVELLHEYGRSDYEASKSVHSFGKRPRIRDGKRKWFVGLRMKETETDNNKVRSDGRENTKPTFTIL
jgi:hypothetical protein